MIVLVGADVDRHPDLYACVAVPIVNLAETIQRLVVTGNRSVGKRIIQDVVNGMDFSLPSKPHKCVVIAAWEPNRRGPGTRFFESRQTTKEVVSVRRIGVSGEEHVVIGDIDRRRGEVT